VRIYHRYGIRSRLPRAIIAIIHADVTDSGDMTQPDMARPERLSVIDLSTDVAGRFAAKLLAMAGLDVVRPAGSRQPPDPGPDLVSIYLDAHKRAVALSSDEDMAQLVSGADVVFTTFDRGHYQGLVDDELVRSLPARCIHTTTSTFGTTGPYASRRGGPLAAWSAGGYLAITGDPLRAPLAGPEHLCGYIGGYTAAIATEAALHGRRRSGQGQHVDVSVMESMLHVHQGTFSRIAAGFGRPRTGRYTEVYPLVVRPCRDGYVSLGVVTDNEFDRFAIAIDRLDLLTDPRFDEKDARWENRDLLDHELDEFLGTHDAAEIVEILQSQGVAAAKVAEPRDLLANPQLAEGGFWEQIDVEGKPGRMPGNPVRPASASAGDGHSQGPPRINPVVRSERLPLAGTVVLDLTAWWAGPSATRWLSDLGAYVIWVERPGSRDDSHTQAMESSAMVGRLFHAKMNRNKHSVVLDLTTPAGQEMVHRLVGEADVLIENSRPGVMDALGLGPSRICAANPKLVYVSLSGFGSRGPWARWRSYGPTIEAASSIEGRTGYPGGEPLRLGHALPDAVGGLVGAVAALQGLRERAARGAGGWFDISQLEAYAAVSGEDLLLQSLSSQPLVRIGNRSRYGAIQGVFPCSGEDSWVAIRLADQQDVHAFASAAGLPAFVDAAGSEPRDDELIEKLITSFTTNRTKDDAAQVLQDAGLEALPVLTPAELGSDAHLIQRGFLVQVPGEAPSVLLPGSPLHGSRDLVDPVGPAPRFGEHAQEVANRLAAAPTPQA
jgi:crotonobetainyl-CoA:carnitine CoA-transferase CaiB-like acyl-CoA transferase